METVVITGGAGFIGSHLARALLENGFAVTIIDDLSTGKLENLKEIRDKITFFDVDIKDKSLLAHIFEGKHVVHLAAKTSVPESIKDPGSYYETNVIGTDNVLSVAKQAGAKKVVLASSAAVYGNATDVSLKEDKIGQVRLSAYALTKYFVEEMGKYYASDKMTVVSLRFFNVFGPRQDPASDYSGVITKFVNQAIKGNQIGIYGNGEQTRDFVYVKNVCDAILAALTKDVETSIINVGSGEPISINSLAKKVVKIAGSSSSIEHKGAREGDIVDSLADIGRAKRLLGYKPSVSFDDGLKLTIEYYQSLK